MGPATNEVVLGAKAKFLRKKLKALVVLDEISDSCCTQNMLSVIVVPRYFADGMFLNVC